MLKRLHLQNFTVFADADFEFSPGLNVLVGTNGTGKSHVLKLGYAVESIFTSSSNNGQLDLFDSSSTHADSNTVFRVVNYLISTFLPGELSNFVRRTNDYNKKLLTKANIKAEFDKSNGALEFVINSTSSSKEGWVLLSQKPTTIGQVGKPVFVPAKEILSLMPDIIGLNERYDTILDSTHTDLAQLLLTPLLRRIPNYVQAMLVNLNQTFQGAIGAENGKFFLLSQYGGRFEINLVAEGYRKIGTLAYLLANGSLDKLNTLYWDEPEANLNPALLRRLAAILAELARQGFQIILATHSTDLLKEFHILSRQKDVKPLPIKYFGLNAEPGEAVRVVSTDNFEFLPDVVALEAQLKQADELEQVFIRDDQAYYANNRGEE